MAKPSKRVREQVVAYLEPRDRALLEHLASETGLSRTELLRRGLWSLAAQGLDKQHAGSAFDYLIATSSGADAPDDLSERADSYLYGGGYAAQPITGAKTPRGKRARAR